jgi:hypothetical protein
MTTQQIDQKVAAFRQMAQDAMERSDGPAALEFVSEVYRQDVRAYDARLAAASDEALNALEDARMRSAMFSSIHAAAAHELIRNARLYATLQRVKYTADLVGRLVQAADQSGRDAVPVEELRCGLQQPTELPQFEPVVTAFYADQRYRAGQFVTADGAVVRSFPFMGWSAVIGSAPADRPIEPTFLVEVELLPVSTITGRFGLELQHLA